MRRARINLFTLVILTVHQWYWPNERRPKNYVGGHFKK